MHSSHFRNLPSYMCTRVQWHAHNQQWGRSANYADCEAPSRYPHPDTSCSYLLHIMYKYAEIETCQVEVLVMVMVSLSEDTNNIMMKITKECLTKAIQYWINFGFSCETLWYYFVPVRRWTSLEIVLSTFINIKCIDESRKNILLQIARHNTTQQCSTATTTSSSQLCPCRALTTESKSNQIIFSTFCNSYSPPTVVNQYLLCHVFVFLFIESKILNTILQK